jgi:hypothetical protein
MAVEDYVSFRQYVVIELPLKKTAVQQTFPINFSMFMEIPAWVAALSDVGRNISKIATGTLAICLAGFDHEPPRQNATSSNLIRSQQTIDGDG